jgi:hypothetical protein
LLSPATLTVGALIGAWSACACAAESASNDGGLKLFLQGYLRDRLAMEDTTTRYSVAPVSLDDKTQMEMVYVSGDAWCGSGGCTALLLTRDRSSFEVIQRFSLARLPIRVLPNVTNAWHDMTMPVAGGGIVPGYLALLRHSGRNYPSNPSTAARFQGRQDGGRELPLTVQGELLYP